MILQCLLKFLAIGLDSYQFFVNYFAAVYLISTSALKRLVFVFSFVQIVLVVASVWSQDLGVFWSQDLELVELV